MTTTTDHIEKQRSIVGEDTMRAATREGRKPRAPRLTSEEIWREVAKRSFTVLSYVTLKGEPRSSGVVYKTVGRRFYVAVAPDSWKARHIATGGRVAVTVPVRRGGILSLAFPIPPATISFQGTALVHPAGSGRVRSLLDELVGLLPAEMWASDTVIEIIPEGAFATYGLGVSLAQMRDPVVARARVPVLEGGRP